MTRFMIILLSLTFLLSYNTGLIAGTSEYLIGAGDIIQIFVWEEPNLNISVPVRPDGRITVPLAGEIMAEKLTTTGLSNSIKEKLENYIKTPTVTVIISDMRSNVAYATGGVLKSGAQQLIHKTNLLQFISMIGGFTEMAKIRKAFIVRGNQKIDLKIKKLIKKKDLQFNITIHKGDVLVVPE